MICPKCGAAIRDNASFCEYCGYAIPAQTNPAAYQQPVQQNYQQDYQQTYQQPVQQAYQQPQAPYANTVEVKKENTFLGIIGALLGSLLGAASIVLFFQMDMVASISGLILAFCTMKGYELLGKKLSNFGIVICILIMLAAPILAYVINGAIYVSKEAGIGFMDSFKICAEMVTSGMITFEDLLEDLGMVYLFAAIGGVGLIVDAFRSNKK